MAIRQQQRVGELQFLLYNRSLHPELFDIYVDQQLSGGPYEATIWITGASHMVSFRLGQATLTELLADRQTMLPERGKLAALPIRGEKNHDVTHADGIRYMASFQVERMSPRVFAKTHQELIDLGARRGLFVPFPEWAGGELVPFSLVDCEAKTTMLHVFAYHAFPDELTLIKTQSIFELT
jgi:hypothetical protein